MSAAVRTVLRVLTIALLALVTGAAAGCGGPKEEAPVPLVAPPAIKTAGELSAGMDLGYAPYAGIDASRQAGIDIDVAAALAERLGLKLVVVDIDPSEAATALADGRIDVALGGLRITDAALADVAFAGSYLVDGPVFFSAKEETLTLGTLGGRRVGAQLGSASFWRLESEFGEGETKSYETLRAAFEALKSGEVDVVAGDAVVGVYIARDFPGLRVAGQLEPAVPVGVAVRKDAPELESKVRESLDALAAEGVLETIRSKWTTGMPELAVEQPGS